MARPIPKAILSQAHDSLGITGHLADNLGAPMFDGAKKCPEMNSNSRLRTISLLHLGIGLAAFAQISRFISISNPWNREN
jgi:hypothetical protein